jgi:hypothetical protein
VEIHASRENTASVIIDGGYPLEPGATLKLDYLHDLSLLTVVSEGWVTLSWIATEFRTTVTPPPVIPAYYVSNTGSDSNDGLSKDKPWKTAAKVNGDPLAAANLILLQGGGIWREMFEPHKIGIQFDRYGDGPDPEVRGSYKPAAWIANTNGANVWKAICATKPINGPVWFGLTNGKVKWGDEVTSVAALTAEYQWFWINGTLNVYAATNPGVRYSWVEVAIRPNGFKAKSGVQNVHINHITVDFTGANGFNFDRSDHNGIEVVGCTAHHIGIIAFHLGYAGMASGIYFEGSDCKALNNTIYQCGSHGIHCYGPVKRVKIIGNGVGDCPHTGVDVKIEVDADYMEDIEIAYNTVFSTADYQDPKLGMNSIFCQSSYPGRIYDIRIHHNKLLSSFGCGVQVGQHCKQVTVDHNTAIGVNPIYPYSGDKTNFAIGYDFEGGVNPTEVTFTNNIAAGFPMGCLYFNDAGTFVLVNGNCLFTSGVCSNRQGRPTEMFKIGDKAAYQKAYGWDARAVWADPKLDGNYKPLPGSPCIGTASDNGNIGAL